MLISKTPRLVTRLFSSIVWTCESDPRLRITFDDGPHPDSTLYILELLEKRNQKATFFCLGKQVEKYPSLYQEIIYHGHQVGNHGYAHLSGWTTSTQDYLADVEKASRFIDSKYFRPAYGRMKPSQFAEIKKSHTVVLWDLMTWDFKKDVSAETVQNSVIKNATADSILLFHDQPHCLNKIEAALSIL